VVKEKSYFAPHDPTLQGSEPCRGSELQERRDPQGSGGVVPKLRVAAETGLESNLFSPVPRRELCQKVRPVVKIRVTSLDTRVVAGSNPATGKCARVAQR
jgi:hypothetical protein